MIVKGAKISDRYQIIKTLGEGGMANVYLANDTILDRNVAVKVLRGDLANDEKFVRRFQREALSASSLSHPNIVEMYDVGEDDGQYYIVMEYVDGKTLKQVLKQRGKLSITEVVDIMLQLTDGMAHAHDAYIIHRDIKPQNIMILSNGMIKITDFGVATALNSTQLTQTNSVMGTVHYLPPEQAQGKGSTIRSDIYSMGIMMYELLTGLVPYKGENAVEIALKHLKEPLPSVRKINSSIPQSIENVIIRATAKNPKNRYVDAREMHEDLKTALDESRANEERYVYKYPENDLDETKILDKELNALKAKSTEKAAVKEEKEEKKKMSKKEKLELEDDDDFYEEPKRRNTFLIVLVSIFTLLVLVSTIVATLYFDKTEVKNAVIPDVTNMSTVDAVNKLTDAGFEVSTDYKYSASTTIPENSVVKTMPEIGTKRKLGTEIVLYLSSGEATYIVEDVIGKNYLVAKGMIEAECDCNVIVEHQAVDEKNKNAKEETVLKTEPAAGEKSPMGESIKIFIPDIEYKYPDLTKYSVTQVQAFCEKHELKLSIKYKDTEDAPEGTVLSQSRAKDAVVKPGASLTITVAQKPEKEQTVVEDATTDEPETSGDDATGTDDQDATGDGAEEVVD